MAMRVQHIKNRKLVYEELPDGKTLLVYEYINGKFHRTVRYSQKMFNLHCLHVQLMKGD